MSQYRAAIKNSDSRHIIFYLSTPIDKLSQYSTSTYCTYLTKSMYKYTDMSQVI